MVRFQIGKGLATARPFPLLRFLPSFGHGDKNEMGKRAWRALFLYVVCTIVPVTTVLIIRLIT